MTARLKPCPFCGSRVSLVSVVCDYGISCPICGLILIGDDTHIITKIWNSRIKPEISQCTLTNEEMDDEDRVNPII